VKVELCCTGVYVTQTDFDTKRQRVKNQDQNAKLIKLTNDTIHFIEHTPNPTAQKIRDLVNGKSNLNPPILKLLEMYMSEATGNYEPATILDWQGKIANLELWLIETKNLKIEARRFNIQAFSQFKAWVIKKKSCGNNHAEKHGYKFRKALRWAVQQGHIAENPLRECELRISQVTNLTHLTWEWVKKLRLYNFDSKLNRVSKLHKRTPNNSKKARTLKIRLVERSSKLKKYVFQKKIKQTVDMYLFSCCTGICYADIINLNATHLEDDPELGLVITNKRQKVTSIYSTPLSRFAKEIYDECGSLEAIPKISNQDVNECIKIALNKIDYPDADIITFHTGRKTFINHCLNDLGIPPHIICGYTGHTDVKQINIYAKIKKTTSIRIFNEKLKEFEDKS